MNPAADATLVEVSSNYRHSTQPRSPSCAVVSAKSFQARSSSMLPFPWDRARMLAGVGSHRGFIRNASTSQGWLETHWLLTIAPLGASQTRTTFPPFLSSTESTCKTQVLATASASYTLPGTKSESLTMRRPSRVSLHPIMTSSTLEQRGLWCHHCLHLLSLLPICILTAHC